MAVERRRGVGRLEGPASEHFVDANELSRRDKAREAREKRDREDARAVLIINLEGEIRAALELRREELQALGVHPDAIDAMLKREERRKWGQTGFIQRRDHPSFTAVLARYQRAKDERGGAALPQTVAYDATEDLLEVYLELRRVDLHRKAHGSIGSNLRTGSTAIRHDDVETTLRREELGLVQLPLHERQARLLDSVLALHLEFFADQFHKFKLTDADIRAARVREEAEQREAWASLWVDRVAPPQPEAGERVEISPPSPLPGISAQMSRFKTPRQMTLRSEAWFTPPSMDGINK